MAKIIQVPYQSDIIVPVETAQSVQTNREKPISLEALGLLVNLLSYPSTWELHKTELYKRFAHNKEASVRSAWNDLIDANYIIEFKYRVGKKWEYVYYFRKVPFTDEEKAEILDAAVLEYGGIWRLDFQDLKMKTSKSRGNQKPLLNQKPLSNQKLKDDDDKRTSSLSEEEELLISNLHEELKEELKDRSFNSVIRKVVDKHKQGKVKSFRDYLVTSLVAKIEELELRREKDKANAEVIKNKANIKRKTLNNIKVKELPFYDWLNE